MKLSEASDPKSTATGKTSGEAVISMPSDAGHRLAFVLQAIESEEMKFAEAKTEHRDALERLRNLAWKIRHEILTGQTSLLDVMQSVTEQINAGALDTDKVKVTAEVNKSA